MPYITYFHVTLEASFNISFQYHFRHYLHLNFLIGLILMKYIFVFLSLFDPQIPYAPNGVGFSLLISLILFPLVIAAPLNTTTLYLIKQGKPFCWLFFMALIIILSRVMLSQGQGFEFTLSWLKAFIVFLSSLLVFIVFFQSQKPIDLINAIIFSFLANALINFIVGTFPEPFVFLELFRTVTISDSLSLNPYRNSFISGSGYFSIGTAYGIFCLFYAYLLSKKNSLIGVITFSIISITAIMAARTSLFAIFLATILITLGSKKNLLYFAIPILLFPFLDSQLSNYYSWIQSFFNFYKDPSGQVIMNDMYFWPGLNIFLYGQGDTNNGVFTYTDSGYMKDILFGGIIFMLIKLTFVFVFFFKTYKKHFIFSFFFCISILIFQIKGAYIYNNAQGMAIFYFIYFSLILNNKIKFLR